MNCIEAGALRIALEDGIISTRDRKRLASHVSVCTTCATLQDSDLRHVRGGMPFAEETFAGIRRSVLQKIESEAGRRPSWRSLFLRASLAGAALVAVLAIPRHAPPPDALQSPPLPVERPASAAPLIRQGDPASVLPNAFSSAQVVVHPARAHSRPAPARRAPAPPPLPDLASDDSAEPVRIELQTSDPDIRIIWFTTPERSTNLTSESSIQETK